MRGVDLAQITFYPIVHDSNNHILTIIENFDIYITEQEIDYSSFQKLIEWSLSEGSHGFVPCGTTGESPTLSHNEHKKII